MVGGRGGNIPVPLKPTALFPDPSPGEASAAGSQFTPKTERGGGEREGEWGVFTATLNSNTSRRRRDRDHLHAHSRGGRVRQREEEARARERERGWEKSITTTEREMAECGRKALSLLEAARSRYESLQISDDVFGESGDDSSDNPFYSTSGDSDSDNCMAEDEQLQQQHKRGDKEGSGHRGGSGAGPPGSLSRSQAEEEGWTETLQDVTVPPFKETYGKT